ncbi:xylulokinase [Komagataeibacter intermedius]|uniref:Xylulose kinase n=2 Tax=Komagataeibacter intermedius TaxID=66229 RepID=A0A0N1FN16_9PROT|nr:xylulokinase [Komagataeibacter intermedius]KPH86191.1 xylulokinase [Komagataeibacter intermedius AF2]MCF3637290.1 xylulokinase [Komagataeibacter intermedius]GAN87772.1 glycerol/xylulose kinase [Komagataeibacter intermedius TF2]GBQ70306.1 glycerol kinase [Komagataeibacter intermedius NRIC 0521]
MFVGIDLGTSALKAVLVDDAQQVVATSTRPLRISTPHPGWSEQAPQDWWAALIQAMDALAADHRGEMAAVTGIGLSGQQHGAVLLDAHGAVLRPCILWNDERAARECVEFERRFPRSRQVCGTIAMPGFTAPKLIWVARHEPDIFRATRHVLLPKAWLRYRLCGEMIEDMSDASGSLWLDVGQRRWCPDALAATGLSPAAMPALVDGTQRAGMLHQDLVGRWGMTARPVIAGSAGDNAAGAVGLGAVRPGSSFLSLGTSGVVWVTTDRFRPHPDGGVHAFCHTVPRTWHQMGVTLSAASSLAWWARMAGLPVADLLAELPPRVDRPSPVMFLPYLSGDRTPHDDPDIRGAFAGLSHDTTRADMTQAVLEGVAFSFRDVVDVMAQAGSDITQADVIGGGSRSLLWVSILSTITGLSLNRLAHGAVDGAFGAARLARIAVTGESVDTVCLPPQREATIHPDPALVEGYRTRLACYRALYPAIRRAFARPPSDHG